MCACVLHMPCVYVCCVYACVHVLSMYAACACFTCRACVPCVYMRVHVCVTSGMSGLPCEVLDTLTLGVRNGQGPVEGETGGW